MSLALRLVGLELSSWSGTAGGVRWGDEVACGVIPLGTNISVRDENVTCTVRTSSDLPTLEVSFCREVFFRSSGCCHISFKRHLVVTITAIVRSPKWINIASNAGVSFRTLSLVQRVLKFEPSISYTTCEPLHCLRRIQQFCHLHHIAPVHQSFRSVFARARVRTVQVILLLPSPDCNAYCLGAYVYVILPCCTKLNSFEMYHACSHNIIATIEQVRRP